MINNDERIKRQMAYETAKRNSENRGVPLTQETEAIMKKFINGEINEQDFFNHISKLALTELVLPSHFH